MKKLIRNRTIHLFGLVVLLLFLLGYNGIAKGQRANKYHEGEFLAV